MSAGDPVDGLLLPPISMLLEHIPGITLHADPYTGPFEAHYHHASRTQTGDVDAISAIVDAHGRPVLDRGRGWGRLALRLARDGHHVTAVYASAPAPGRLGRHQIRGFGDAAMDLVARHSRGLSHSVVVIGVAG